MRASMGDDWRVRIALGDLPRELTADEVYAALPGQSEGVAAVEPRWSPSGRRLSLHWAAASAIR